MPDSKKKISLHLFLFILTLITSTLAGAEWTGLHSLDLWDFLLSGLNYSLTFIGILTMHEFGHYYFAKKYKVDVSLPYYLPFYLPGAGTIGTFGAFIRMKSMIVSRKHFFDIGIAGPLAGFAGALALLIYGFATLPEKEYIYKVHPDYAAFGDDYASHVYTYEYMKMQSDRYVDYTFNADSIEYEKNKKENPDLKKPEKSYQTEFTEIAIGNNLLLSGFKKLFSYQGDKIPNKFEFFHYPFLLAAYLALFFTALNLIPVGQLDGGHVIFGLFGQEWHKKISSTFFILFVFLNGIGLFKTNPLGINFFSANYMDQIEFGVVYIFFLYLLFAKMYQNYMNALLTAVAIFTLQFLIEYFFPEAKGQSGWLLYAFLIGRFLGVHHPPTIDERPLDVKRKILGWLALLIFVLCFTPNVFEIYTIAK